MSGPVIMVLVCTGVPALVGIVVILLECRPSTPAPSTARKDD